ncbi:hypothetical protein CYMTET_57078 [Cymbomonas tetramitiformis]|uniref:Uncharacterized protein n=1 Tax=Cymbomonas tetramitiformis TaxID=36881 RepID=A0AAE0BAX4_9CHLO|nr:hypothetical protein CYMTET_57078 [Cymbomonas tetramitiformis]
MGLASVQELLDRALPDLEKILEKKLKNEGKCIVPYECAADVSEIILTWDNYELKGPLWKHILENKLFTDDSILRVTEKMEEYCGDNASDATPAKKAPDPPVTAEEAHAAQNLAEEMQAAKDLLPYEEDGNPLDQLQVHAELDAFSVDLVSLGLITCQELVKVTADGWEYVLLGQCLDQGGLKDGDGKPVIIHADFGLENGCGKELLLKCLEDGSKYNVFESELYKADEKNIVSNMLTLCQERYGPQPGEEDTRVIVDAPHQVDEDDGLEQPRSKAREGRKLFLLEFEEVNSLGLPLLVGLAWLKQIWRPPASGHAVADRVVIFNLRKPGNPGVFPTFGDAIAYLTCQHGDVKDITFVFREDEDVRAAVDFQVVRGPSADDPEYLSFDEMAQEDTSNVHRTNVKNARTELVPRLVNGKQPVYVYLEAQFTREKKLTYRMPLVQGMQVEIVMDLGQEAGLDLHGATIRFVCANLSQGSSGQWHATLLSEKHSGNTAEYVMFQTPLLQNRHVTLKREEHFCDRYPFLQLQSNKVYAHDIRLPDYADGDLKTLPTKLPFADGEIAEEAERYQGFKQVLAFAWEKIAAEEQRRSEQPGGARTAAKVGDTNYWTLASSNFSAGLTFRLVGTVTAYVMSSGAPMQLSDSTPYAKQKVPGNHAGEGSKNPKGNRKAVSKAKGKGASGAVKALDSQTQL